MKQNKEVESLEKYKHNLISIENYLYLHRSAIDPYDWYSQMEYLNSELRNIQNGIDYYKRFSPSYYE